MKVSQESLSLIHGLYASAEFRHALKEICEAEAALMTDTTRANIRAGHFSLATVSEAATTVFQDMPLIFKKYADAYGRRK